MDIFAPGSPSEFDDGSFTDSMDAMDSVDPWMHDGLPSIDVNEDVEDAPRPAVYFEDPDDVDHFPDDDAPSNQGSANSVKEAKSAAFPRLMTGAELAAEEDAHTSVRLHPNSFEEGMRVLHAEYGIGTVTTLTGEGQKRTATIDFPGRGKKRIRVAFCKLRAVP